MKKIKIIILISIIIYAIFVNFNNVYAMSKLKLMVHNNKLQKQLCLNLYDYRLFSGKYSKKKMVK